MKDFNRIVILTSVTGLLAISLLGFVLLNKDRFGTEMGEEILYCGTASLNDDVAVESDPKASEGKRLFNANCKTCHRLDQKVVGPALRNVYSYRDSVWIRQMIVNANKLIRRKDKIAVALYKEYHPIQHVEFTSLKKEEVDALMQYLKVVQNE